MALSQKSAGPSTYAPVAGAYSLTESIDYMPIDPNHYPISHSRNPSCGDNTPLSPSSTPPDSCSDSADTVSPLQDAVDPLESLDSNPVPGNPPAAIDDKDENGPITARSSTSQDEEIMTDVGLATEYEDLSYRRRRKSRSVDTQPGIKDSQPTLYVDKAIRQRHQSTIPRSRGAQAGTSIRPSRVTRRGQEEPSFAQSALSRSMGGRISGRSRAA